MEFLLTPLREGRQYPSWYTAAKQSISTHAPAGGATRTRSVDRCAAHNFYSRPCGRGDIIARIKPGNSNISTHAPAGGATSWQRSRESSRCYFYSRPCGRGDERQIKAMSVTAPFLLTPLREGRPVLHVPHDVAAYFYSRPCGRGDIVSSSLMSNMPHFYSRPCGRGDVRGLIPWDKKNANFYSRPCGRGDAVWRRPGG